MGFRIVTSAELELRDDLQRRADAEIGYLKTQLAAEQTRNERLMDNLCLINGTPPVSNEARADHKDRAAKAAELARGLGELLLDETLPSTKDAPSDAEAVN